MPPIQWAANSYQARALPLSAQRIINFYAEQAPKDGKSPVALLTAPGIKTFCNNVGDGPIRGMEVMDDVLYVLSSDVLYSVSPDCVVTAHGSIGVGADSTSTTIVGAKVPATASFEITGGTAGSGNAITSITVDGEELLGGSTAWVTSNAATAAALLDPVVGTTPNVKFVASTNSTPEGSFSDITISTPSHVEGDLLFAFIGRHGIEDDTITASESGWTAVFENAWSSRASTIDLCDASGVGFVARGGSCSMFWRIATASEPANYTWNYDGNGSEHAIGSIMSIENHHPTVPIHTFRFDLLDDCGTGNRRFVNLGNLTTTLDNTLKLISLCVTEIFFNDADPIGNDWTTNLDAFKGPIPTSTQLQLFSQGGVNSAGTIGDLIHSDFNTVQPGFVLESLVTAALAISPAISGPLPSSSYDLTTDDAIVIITAPDGTGAEQNGFEMIVTTTGDVTVACI